VPWSSGEGPPRWSAAAKASGGAEGGSGALGLGRGRAAVAVELREGFCGVFYRRPRRWSGAGGAGERDGTRRRVAGGAVRGSLPLYRVNDGRRRSVSVRGSLGTAACERLERDRRRARERPVARAGASLVRARRAARGGVLGSGPAQRGGRAGPGGVRGEEDQAGPGALRGRSGVQGGVSRWRARPGGAGGRRGRVTRAAEKKGRREREREGEGKGKKEKKMEKEKWREKKRGREMDPRRDHGADRGAGRPRSASGRARARRAGRGETGCWIRVSGLWGIGRSGGTGRIPENWG